MAQFLLMDFFHSRLLFREVGDKMIGYKSLFVSVKCRHFDNGDL